MDLGVTRYGANTFTKSILEKKPIKVFNHGDMMRDLLL